MVSTFDFEEYAEAIRERLAELREDIFDVEDDDDRDSDDTVTDDDVSRSVDENGAETEDADDTDDTRECGDRETGADTQDADDTEIYIGNDDNSETSESSKESIPDLDFDQTLVDQAFIECRTKIDAALADLKTRLGPLIYTLIETHRQAAHRYVADQDWEKAIAEYQLAFDDYTSRGETAKANRCLWRMVYCTINLENYDQAMTTLETLYRRTKLTKYLIMAVACLVVSTQDSQTLETEFGRLTTMGEKPLEVVNENVYRQLRELVGYAMSRDQRGYREACSPVRDYFRRVVPRLSSILYLVSMGMEPQSITGGRPVLACLSTTENTNQSVSQSSAEREREEYVITELESLVPYVWSVSENLLKMCDCLLKAITAKEQNLMSIEEIVQFQTFRSLRRTVTENLTTTKAQCIVLNSYREEVRACTNGVITVDLLNQFWARLYELNADITIHHNTLRQVEQDETDETPFSESLASDCFSRITTCVFALQKIQNEMRDLAEARAQHTDSVTPTNMATVISA